MVAFARAKAKSIFSKLRFTAISKQQFGSYTKETNSEIYTAKEKSSNKFLEAIKSGGIWLS
tara:strand:- start:125 stop:307 length:183 start_codon:yes stop_codon:yes gene_type:complete